MQSLAEVKSAVLSDQRGLLTWLNAVRRNFLALRSVRAGIVAQAVLDFPSVAANGGTQDTTVAVSGAAVGDSAMATPPDGMTAGLVFHAWVSAPATVSVRATNATSGAIDPPAGTFTVSVFGIEAGG